MGSSFDGTELPGLKIQIISCPSLILAVTAIQKGIYRPALERLFGHNGLTTTEIQHKLLPAKVLREFRDKWSSKASRLLQRRGMAIFLLQTGTDDR
jgi:hypothetical protein